MKVLEIHYRGETKKKYFALYKTKNDDVHEPRSSR